MVLGFLSEGLFPSSAGVPGIFSRQPCRTSGHAVLSLFREQVVERSTLDLLTNRPDLSAAAGNTRGQQATIAPLVGGLACAHPARPQPLPVGEDAARPRRAGGGPALTAAPELHDALHGTGAGADPQAVRRAA